MKPKRITLSAIFFLLTASSAWPQAHYAGNSARDPFFDVAGSGPRQSEQQKQSSGWVLEGIMWTPDRKQAYINGEKVKVGDVVRGAEVIDIDRKIVRLKFNGKAGNLTKQGIEWT